MSAEKRTKRPWPIRLCRWGGILFALYLLLGFVMVPLAVKLIAPSLVSREVAGDVHIGWVWMNPLVFSVTLRNVEVTGTDGAPVLSFERLYANADPVRSIFSGELTAAALTLRGLHLRVHIDEAGEINLAKAFEPTRPPAPPPPQPEVREPIDVPAAVLRRFALEEARIDFSDHSRGLLFEKSITSLSIELNDIRTRPDHENVYEFTAVTGADERIHLSGMFQLNPLSLAGSVDIAGIHLPAYGAFYEDLVAVEIVSGRAFGGLDFAFRPLGEDRELGLSNGRFSLENLDLRERGAEEPFFLLERFAITGISLDLFGHKAHIDEIGISTGHFRAERLPDGSINLLELLPEADPSSAERPSGPPAAAAEPLAFGVRADGEDMAEPINVVLAHLETLAESDWRIGLGRFFIEAFAVEVLDRVPVTPTPVRLHGIGFSLEGFSNEPGSEASLNFRMGVNDTGLVTIGGEVGIDPLNAKLGMKVSDLALGDFGPILETFVPVVLESATLDFSVMATVEVGDGEEPEVDAVGDLHVRNFSVRQSGESDTFLAFTEFRVTEAAVVSEPLAAEVREIVWEAPRIRVERRADGQLALFDLLPEAAAEEVEQTLEELAEATEEEVEAFVDEALADLPIQVALGRFLLRDGRVEWVDAAVRPTARLVVSALDLEVSDIHLEPDASRPTRIDMSATFADEGRIRVEGGLIPADPSLQSAAVVEVRDLPLRVFTPYAADAVGRPITEGAFSADFDVSIEENALDSRNQLRVQSIRFGSTIPGSSGATLPVGVAVAALQDRNGLISLDVPIRGDLDNPDFQPGRLFVGILRNAVMRALTAPLSIAGSLVGGSIPGLSLLQGEGSGEAPLDLSSISFAPGSSELSPLALRTLEALSAFLRERPEARLQIIPSVDPEGDFEAQARQRLESRLADLGAPSRSQAIRQLYGETFGVPIEVEVEAVEDAPAVAQRAAPRPPPPGGRLPARGFFLSGDQEREVERSGFFVAGASPRRPGERGFYTGQRPPEPRPEPRAPATPVRESTDDVRADTAAPDAPPRPPTDLRSMERRLLAGFPPDDDALAVLARERAESVRQFFLESSGIPPDRLIAAPADRPFRRAGAQVIFEFATDLD
ncbi:MAG: DUF748 domain-containing protein [Opitutales bacterium]|nr:DUF748 domain-containing protein [Opitutales bacterium]